MRERPEVVTAATTGNRAIVKLTWKLELLRLEDVRGVTRPRGTG